MSSAPTASGPGRGAGLSSLPLGALAALFLACTSPSAELVVELPSDAALRPVTIGLRVVEPGAQAFGCDELAYGLVPDIVLAATERSRTFLAPGQRATLDTSRSGNRLLLLDGLDRAGESVVRGCTAMGTVEGTLRLAVKLEPVVHVRGRPVPERIQVATGGAVPQVTLLLVDALDHPVSGVAARWFLAGTGTLQVLGDAGPSVNGALTVRAASQQLSGPFVLTVAPRWGTPVQVGGMIEPHLLALAEFPPVLQALDYVAGRVGPAGEPGFTTLASFDGGTTHVVAFRTDGGFVVSAPGPLLPGARLLALVESLTPGRDTAVGINQSGWAELPAGNAVVHPGFQPLPAPVIQVTSLWDLDPRSCDGPPGLVALRLANDELRVFTRAGVPTPHPLEGIRAPVLATGCLSQLDGGATPAAVVDLPLLATFVQRLTPNPGPPLQLLAAPVGLGFTRFRGRHELIATRMDRSVYLASRLVVSDELPPALVATWELSLPSVPFTPVGGDLDGDGAADLAALLSTPSLDGGTTPDTYVLLALGRQLDVPGAKAVAGTIGPLSLCNPRLWLQDLDGDRTDDLVVGERAPCAHQQTVRAWLMGPPAR